MKKKYILWITVLGIFICLTAGGCSLFDDTDYVPIVQNGYLGEYTDITVKDLLSSYYSNRYDEETWGGGPTDEGKEIVEVKFTDSEEIFKDVTIQFSMFDEERFAVTAFVDPAEMVHTNEDVFRVLNKIYLDQHTLAHPDFYEDIEIAEPFMEKLEGITASSVRYGASAEYGGDRARLCEAAGDTPSEMTVIEAMFGEFDWRTVFTYEDVETIQKGYYDQDEEPNELEESSDSDKYASVEDFLNDPDVSSILEETMADLGDEMVVDISAEGDTLVYTFTFTEEIMDIEAVGKEMLKEMYDPDFSSTFEGIAASLSEAIEVTDPCVRIVYKTLDGTTICHHDFFPN